MNVNLDLPPEVRAALMSQAQASGISLEAFAERVLKEKSREELHVSCEGSNPAPGANEPFWQSFISQVHSLPDLVFERLPADGASEHDHYLYGAPKKNA